VLSFTYMNYELNVAACHLSSGDDTEENIATRTKELRELFSNVTDELHVEKVHKNLNELNRKAEIEYLDKLQMKKDLEHKIKDNYEQ